MAAHQKILIPVDEVKKHKVWFEYLFNAAEPATSTYRCRLCYKYYDEFGLEGRYKSALANVGGTLKKYKADNKKSIAEHGNSPGHTAVVQILQERSAKRFFSSTFLNILTNIPNLLIVYLIFNERLRTDFADIQRKENDVNEGNLKVTAAMFRTVFIEIKKKYPLQFTRKFSYSPRNPRGKYGLPPLRKVWCNFNS